MVFLVVRSKHTKEKLTQAKRHQDGNSEMELFNYFNNHATNLARDKDKPRVKTWHNRPLLAVMNCFLITTAT